MARQRESVKARITRTIRRAGGCWIWTGSSTKDGYGVLTIGRKQHRAHRASFEVFKGEIPSGQKVCHRCDTPLCVNPGHLFLGTARDNTQDMIAKGRRVKLVDQAHPNTKVTHAQREIIRQQRRGGAKLADLASQYGIAFQTVSGICTGANSYGSR